jgi:uncharacterized protein YggE
MNSLMLGALTALVPAAVLAAAPAARPEPAVEVVASPSELARYDKAPWWMDKPIIASSGHVQTKVLANRAEFDATYESVDHDTAAATKAAADKVRALGQALAAYGPEKVRVETTFHITPLYDQYRDKNGELQDNERADRIRTYQVSAQVKVEVRDLALLERAYATALAARPSHTGEVSFELEPDDDSRTRMFQAAVQDAVRRARLASEAAGARLGPVRLIDPTGRACETDVLVAGAQRIAGEVADVASVPAPPALMQPRAAMNIPGGAKHVVAPELRPEDLQLPLQPPLESLEASACVVFALG